MDNLVRCLGGLTVSTLKARMILGAMMAMSATAVVGAPRMTTPDNSKDEKPWHDPERVERAKQKKSYAKCQTS
jgi:hypothetical protein